MSKYITTEHYSDETKIKPHGLLDRYARTPVDKRYAQKNIGYD